MEKDTNFKDLECFNNKKVIEATYKEMGKRAQKAVALHILRENLYEGNLINDISGINYTKNNSGKTFLKQIPNFNTFVDDIYVYGYLRKEDVVYDTTGKVYCTQGEIGSASCIIEHIRSIVKQTIGKNSNLPHVNIMHTINFKKDGNGNILKTIRSIEKEKDVCTAWKNRTLQEPEAVFVVKIDVSNILIEELQKYMEEMEQNLLVNGFFIFSVDYTQDFSGTLNKEDLIDYLLEEGFAMEGLGFTMEGENNKIILKNDNNVGRNVLTYLRIEEEKIFRIKAYNKFVSNIEAGDVRSQFGGHVYDSACSSSNRLRNLFCSEDVKNRGVTRLEISVYGKQERLNTNLGQYLIEREFNLLNSIRPLFYVQPTSRQWIVLTEAINKCFILVDKPHALIYIAWYGNTITGRIVGIKIDFSKKQDKDNIEDLILWAASDFGFRKIPIFISVFC